MARSGQDPDARALFAKHADTDMLISVEELGMCLEEQRIADGLTEPFPDEFVRDLFVSWNGGHDITENRFVAGWQAYVRSRQAWFKQWQMASQQDVIPEATPDIVRRLFVGLTDSEGALPAAGYQAFCHRFAEAHGESPPPTEFVDAAYRATMTVIERQAEDLAAAPKEHTTMAATDLPHVVCTETGIPEEWVSPVLCLYAKHHQKWIEQWRLGNFQIQEAESFGKMHGVKRGDEFVDLNATTAADIDREVSESSNAHKVELVVGPGIARLGFAPSAMPPGCVYVQDVQRFSWAEQSGLQKGDRLLQVGDWAIAHMMPEDLAPALLKRPLRLTFIRALADGENLDASIRDFDNVDLTRNEMDMLIDRFDADRNGRWSAEDLLDALALIDSRDGVERAPAAFGDEALLRIRMLAGKARGGLQRTTQGLEDLTSEEVRAGLPDFAANRHHYLRLWSSARRRAVLECPCCSGYFQVRPDEGNPGKEKAVAAVKLDAIPKSVGPMMPDSRGVAALHEMTLQSVSAGTSVIGLPAGAARPALHGRILLEAAATRGQPWGAVGFLGNEVELQAIELWLSTAVHGPSPDVLRLSVDTPWQEIEGWGGQGGHSRQLFFSTPAVFEVLLNAKRFSISDVAFLLCSMDEHDPPSLQELVPGAPLSLLSPPPRVVVTMDDGTELSRVFGAHLNMVKESRDHLERALDFLPAIREVDGDSEVVQTTERLIKKLLGEAGRYPTMTAAPPPGEEISGFASPVSPQRLAARWQPVGKPVPVASPLSDPSPQSFTVNGAEDFRATAAQRAQPSAEVQPIAQAVALNAPKVARAGGLRAESFI